MVTQLTQLLTGNSRSHGNCTTLKKQSINRKSSFSNGDLGYDQSRPFTFYDLRREIIFAPENTTPHTFFASEGLTNNSQVLRELNKKNFEDTNKRNQELNVALSNLDLENQELKTKNEQITKLLAEQRENFELEILTLKQELETSRTKVGELSAHARAHDDYVAELKEENADLDFKLIDKRADDAEIYLSMELLSQRTHLVDGIRKMDLSEHESVELIRKFSRFPFTIYTSDEDSSGLENLSPEELAIQKYVCGTVKDLTRYFINYARTKAVPIGSKAAPDSQETAFQNSVSSSGESRYTVCSATGGDEDNSRNIKPSLENGWACYHTVNRAGKSEPCGFPNEYGTKQCGLCKNDFTPHASELGE
ncbi:hypothetical protein GLAREA_04457 [Glarea lozoyensis ATCC 20868]|uniref:Uncharacterized protein n=1 Tax=Glarea lozoyensis (strain ATCC 20868 / MF5171) TaxID=1116229 RepID=S3D6K0_GLAL2|nr:uncharacterized protein GLAREA_04457 [Glarea lozoyensis ATCC 20868]EPE27666.1 hypothetical protein GLAREA_04457 [Glarea lozoyensis ATCC 20868]